MRRRRKTGHAHAGRTRGQANLAAASATRIPVKEPGPRPAAYGWCPPARRPPRERGAGELGHQGGMAVTGVMRMLNAGAVTAQHGGRCPVGARFERQNYEIILSVGHSVRLLVRQLQPEHQLALARPCLAQYDRAIIHL